MGLSPTHKTITVTGTNGKGSVAKTLESILTAAGIHAGAFTSPHLVSYRERISLGQDLVSERMLAEALSFVEEARGETSLTYFEFSALAALWIFQQRGIEAAVLEVGLGGRLDAVNILDADVAVVTTVDIDHTQYLGETKEDIAREKAGIFRPGRPVVYGDDEPPQAISRRARALGCPLWLCGQDFQFQRENEEEWVFAAGERKWVLPAPRLFGDHQVRNAATAIAALLAGGFPVSHQDMIEGLEHVRLPGRFQVLKHNPTIVADVAHNPQAARVLAENLKKLEKKRTLALCSLLADKDIEGVIKAMDPVADIWAVAPLDFFRAPPLKRLENAVREVTGKLPLVFPSVQEGFSSLSSSLLPGDVLVVFGSFHTVGEALLCHGSP